MAGPSTRDEFLELVRKSRVVDEQRLDTYLEAKRAAAALPEEVGKIAGLLVRDGILTHFQAEQIAQGKYRRFTIGKYKVLERIGSGGMGSVYLCEHTLMRRRVAIKVLPTSRAAETSAVERFYREARAVAALDHPNIVRAYDIDQDDKLHFIVMEYIDGASLQEIVKRHGPLDIHRAAHYMAQAADALQHAHEFAQLIHRDIKPGNILVDRSGAVKVLDMGLARFFNDDESSITERFDENVLGTADYLAPEQALDSHNVDIRADIYSLGATFYFCLTGATPFEGGTVAQKLIWHQTRQPKSVRALRPEVPEELAAVVDKMMLKEPQLRFQMPADIVVALAPWTSEPIAPPPEHEMPRLSLAAGGSSVNLSDSGAASTPTPTSRVPGPASRKWATASPVPKPPSGNSGSAAGAVRRSTRTGTITPQPLSRSSAGTSPAPTQAQGTVRAHPAHRRATPETDNFRSQHDTLPNSPPARRIISYRSRRRRSRIRRIQVLSIAVVAGVVLLTFLSWLFFWRGGSGGNAIQAHKPPTGTWLVTKSDHPNSFRTVRDALYQARAGDQILVLDDRIEEPLILVDGHKGKDITIRAGNHSGLVVWKCPPNPPEGRFVALSNVQGFRLQGFVLDGQDHVDNLVVLSGPCPGLFIEDVSLRGFRQNGIVTWNCQGRGENAPVTLSNVRAISTHSEVDAGLVFNADSRTNAPVNQHFVIQECRFEGPFRKAAVQLASPVLGIEFRHNRFYKTENGFVYVKATPRYPAQITLDSNTFCDVQKIALHFEGIPLSSTESRIIVRNNLFAHTAKLAQIGEPERIGEAGLIFNLSSNVCDPTSQEGNLPLRARRFRSPCRLIRPTTMPSCAIRKTIPCHVQAPTASPWVCRLPTANRRSVLVLRCSTINKQI